MRDHAAKPRAVQVLAPLECVLLACLLLVSAAWLLLLLLALLLLSPLLSPQQPPPLPPPLPLPLPPMRHSEAQRLPSKSLALALLPLTRSLSVVLNVVVAAVCFSRSWGLCQKCSPTIPDTPRRAGTSRTRLEQRLLLLGS
eukprot:TRINITY_DN6588_c0_g1_i1.p2 TRINITY_DN6588_c0_g1~~TRINITY_DN6588_c0_g1_i1.p2  ORF type:complete len:141 (-),score=34.00 TRINITY_DN6588_c0_g1_i1:263-685(-)